MPENFTITQFESSGNATVMRIGGHLDVKSTPLLIEHARRIRESKRCLILNLSDVTFIASNGIGGLLSLVEEFSGAGLSIRLASLSVAVESVLKLLNLDQYLDIDTTESAALARLEA